MKFCRYLDNLLLSLKETRGKSLGTFMFQLYREVPLHLLGKLGRKRKELENQRIVT